MLSPHPQTILVDANVLYSRTLRDWLALIYLEDAGLFRVCWTTDILAETLHHLRKKHPNWDGAKIEAARRHIEGTFLDGRIADFVVDESFQGKDPGDAHVHAAAIACAADMLLTFNASDFLPSGIDADELSYEVWHPDEFFVLIDDSAPHVVREVTARQVKYWFEQRGEADLCRHLRDAGVPKFADRVRRHLLALHL
jgi:hypothetical protein